MKRKSLDSDYWTAQLASQERSGLSLSEYARRHGLALSTLYYFRKTRSQAFLPVSVGQRPARSDFSDDVVITIKGAGGVAIELPDSLKRGILPLVQELLG